MRRVTDLHALLFDAGIAMGRAFPEEEVCCDS
jgi:hypothetical protein